MRALMLLGVLLCGGLAATDVSAQQVPASASPLQKVPTTKVLAIGHLTKPRDAAMREIMPNEVTETVKLYLGGKIDQWFVRQDGNGVVFLMNVTSVEEAHALLEKLPLGVAGRMDFDLMPLGPLSPLQYLLMGGTPVASKP
jgi:hypothetical protein